MSHTVIINRMKKMGLAAFLFFLLKGMVWLVIAWMAMR